MLLGCIGEYAPADRVRPGDQRRVEDRAAARPFVSPSIGMTRIFRDGGRWREAAHHRGRSRDGPDSVEA